MHSLPDRPVVRLCHVRAVPASRPIPTGYKYSAETVHIETVPCGGEFNVTKRLIDLGDDMLAAAHGNSTPPACPTPSSRPYGRRPQRRPGPDRWSGEPTAPWRSWPTRTGAPRSGADPVALARFLIDTSAAARMHHPVVADRLVPLDRSRAS